MAMSIRDSIGKYPGEIWCPDPEPVFAGRELLSLPYQIMLPSPVPERKEPTETCPRRHAPKSKKNRRKMAQASKRGNRG